MQYRAKRYDIHSFVIAFTRTIQIQQICMLKPQLVSQAVCCRFCSTFVLLLINTNTQTASCNEITTAKFIRTTYKKHKILINMNEHYKNSSNS